MTAGTNTGSPRKLPDYSPHLTAPASQVIAEFRLTDGTLHAFLPNSILHAFHMISRRSIILMFLLLPLAAKADISAPEHRTSGGLLNWFGPKADGVRYDSRMIHAAQIAESRARQHSIRSCWRYVKEALLEANVVNTYPGTTYAKQAGDELINKHGFRRLSISDPFKAPIGSVLVYGGPGAGHVEIRTKDGFVSDFESPTPSRRPLLGIFVKPT